MLTQLALAVQASTCTPLVATEGSCRSVAGLSPVVVPDRTAFFGDNFRIGGYSSGTTKRVIPWWERPANGKEILVRRADNVSGLVAFAPALICVMGGSSPIRK
jgi:hypothetical protein